MIARLDELSIALAVHLHCTPAAVDEMPVVDVCSQMERIYDDERQRARFEAELHGRELR